MSSLYEFTAYVGGGVGGQYFYYSFDGGVFGDNSQRYCAIISEMAVIFRHTVKLYNARVNMN